MQEIVQFVSTSIASGVVGSVAYDGLKAVLGSSFDMLSDYLSTNKEAEFNGALTMLLMQNEALKQQIIELQQGKSIVFDNSVDVGGNNSGNIVTGSNNTVSK